RFDAGAAQLVGETGVEVEAFRVRRTSAVGEDPGPCDREAVGGGPDVLHQRDVFLVPVIVVVGDVAVLVVLDAAGYMGEGVPDRHPFAVLVPRPLDLVRGRGDTPVEALGEPAAGGRRRSGCGGAHVTCLLAAALPSMFETRLSSLSTPDVSPVI